VAFVQWTSGGWKKTFFALHEDFSVKDYVMADLASCSDAY